MHKSSRTIRDRGGRELRGERRGIGERSLKVDGRSVFFCTLGPMPINRTRRSRGSAWAGVDQDPIRARSTTHPAGLAEVVGWTRMPCQNDHERLVQRHMVALGMPNAPNRRYSQGDWCQRRPARTMALAFPLEVVLAQAKSAIGHGSARAADRYFYSRTPHQPRGAQSSGGGARKQ